MSRMLILAAATALLCAGCRSRQVSTTAAACRTANQPDVTAPASSDQAATRPAAGFVGTWEKVLPSGDRIVMELQGGTICFCAPFRQESQLRFEGTIQQASARPLEGLITKFEMGSSNTHVSLSVKNEFTLAFEQQGDSMLVRE